MTDRYRSAFAAPSGFKLSHPNAEQAGGKSEPEKMAVRQADPTDLRELPTGAMPRTARR